MVSTCELWLLYCLANKTDSKRNPAVRISFLKTGMKRKWSFIIYREFSLRQWLSHKLFSSTHLMLHLGVTDSPWLPCQCTLFNWLIKFFLLEKNQLIFIFKFKLKLSKNISIDIFIFLKQYFLWNWNHLKEEEFIILYFLILIHYKWWDSLRW